MRPYRVFIRDVSPSEGHTRGTQQKTTSQDLWVAVQICGEEVLTLAIRTQLFVLSHHLGIE